MVTTRANIYESNTKTKSSMSHPTKYNLRPRKTNGSSGGSSDNCNQVEKLQQTRTKREVTQYIKSLKTQYPQMKGKGTDIDADAYDATYYLRSKIYNSPRVNYARFYTSNPDQYLPHHFIRRSPRISGIETSYRE